MNPTPEQLVKTGRTITAGIWVCAVITMTASVVNGTSVFATLDDGALAVMVGLFTALAVDAALVVVLTGDARMQAMGLSSRWGRVLRWTALLMSLALNCGASLLTGHEFLAALHAIPPLLLCGLSEYGQEVGLQFARAARRQCEAVEATARAAAEREAERIRVVAHERELAAAAEQRAVALAREAEQQERLAAAKASQVAMVEQATAPVLHLAAGGGKRQPARDRSPGRSAPVRGDALRWLIGQRHEGRDITQIPPAEMVRELGANPHTVKAKHKQWKQAALLAEAVAG